MENQPIIVPVQPTPVMETKPAPVKIPKPEETRRLTVDVPLSLHRRIKIKCVMEDAGVSDVVRKVLERAFPEQKNN